MVSIETSRPGTHDYLELNKGSSVESGPRLVLWRGGDPDRVLKCLLRSPRTWGCVLSFTFNNLPTLTVSFSCPGPPFKIRQTIVSLNPSQNP